MKRKLVTILIGCMTLGLFGCGSGLSDTTKQLTPQQSEDSEQTPIIQEMRISRPRLIRQKRKRKMAAQKHPSVTDTDTVSLP